MPTPGPTRFAATLIRTSARGLASLAARELVEGEPGEPAPGGFTRWQEIFESQLGSLATALATGRGSLFAAQLSWASAALEVRDVEPEEFERGIEVLSRVLAQELPEEAGHSAQEILAAARAELRVGRREPEAWISPEAPHGDAAARYLLHVLEGDRPAACRLVEEAAESGVPIASIFRDILIPAQREIGRMWHMGEIHVGEEHFATLTFEKVLADLSRRLTPEPRNGLTVVAAAMDGNHHDLGIRIVAEFFEAAGWRTICLGGSMPAADIGQALVDFRADLLALSVTLTNQLGQLERFLQGIRAGQNEKVPILLGGSAFASHPELAKDLGGDGYASDFEEAVRVAQTLVQGR